MLLYVHIPFCRRKCRYCAFFSRPLPEGGGKGADGPLARYLAALGEELSQWGERLGEREVESVFFGGGTPSLLEPEVLAAVLERVRRTFALRPDAEISMEANPDSLHTEEKARGFLDAGINRISLGVQSFDDGRLHTLGRVHRVEEARAAFRAIRKAGCGNLSLDLMWGLPGQTLEDWQAEVREALSLEPDHLSAYGLTLEEGTPLAEDVEKGLLDLPSEETQCAMYLEGIRLFEEAGLSQYEISNFARPGFRCRHNLGYWEGRDYLGLGPAAASTLNGERWTNPEGEAWFEQVREGRPCAEREALDTSTRALELMMLRLRTVKGLALDDYAALTGRAFLDEHGAFVRRLCEGGLAEAKDRTFRLTRQGMLVSNSILGELFEEEQESSGLREKKPA